MSRAEYAVQRAGGWTPRSSQVAPVRFGVTFAPGSLAARRAAPSPAQVALDHQRARNLVPQLEASLTSLRAIPEAQRTIFIQQSLAKASYDLSLARQGKLP